MANIQLKIKKTNGEYLILNKKWIDDLETLSQSTSDPSTIQYGCLGNSGSAKLRDIDGSIRNLIEIGELNNSNVPVQIVVNGNVIQNHILSDSDYNITDKTFSITMKNSISNWENLVYSGRDLTESTNLYIIFQDIMSSNFAYTPEEIGNMMDSLTKTNLQSINIEYPYLEKGNLKETINKICSAGQLNIFLNEDNIPSVILSRPIIKPTSKEIHIPKNCLISNLNNTIILKNKYDGISIKENKINDNLQYSVLCYSDKKSIEDIDYSSSESGNNRVLERSTLRADYRYTYAYEHIYYKTFTFSIPKKSNLGLDNIMSLYDGTDSDGNPFLKYSVKYLKKTGSATLNTTIPEPSAPISHIDEDIVIRNYTDETGEEIQMSNSKFSTYTYSPVDIGDIQFPSCIVELEDKSSNKNIGIYTEYEDKYEVTLNLLVKKEQFGIPAYAETVSSIIQYYDGLAELYIPKEIEISCYGTKKIISFDEIDVSSDNILSASTTISIDINELIEDKTTFNGLKLTNYIKNNILSDYSMGISNGTIDIFCTDLYYSDNTLAKDWDKGEIINVGDIIYFDNDTYANGSQRYWRVTGRIFKYSGAPTLSLELQECKKIN